MAKKKGRWKITGRGTQMTSRRKYVKRKLCVRKSSIFFPLSYGKYEHIIRKSYRYEHSIDTFYAKRQAELTNNANTIAFQQVVGIVKKGT